MTSIYKILTVVLLFIFIQDVQTQTLRLYRADDIKVDPGVNPANLNQILKVTEETLNNYALQATLFDKEAKRVTESSVDKFHALFSPNAKVVKDYAEHVPVNLISYKDYSLEVYNRLKLKGVETILKKAEVKEVKYDATGFYVPVVLVTKTIFTSISNDGKLKMIPSGRTIEQLITFDIYTKNLEVAKISEINHGKMIKPADEYTRIFQLSAGLGTTSMSSSTTNYWNQLPGSGSLESTGGLDFSLGVEWMTDRFITSKNATNRNLALSVGLRFASTKISTDVNDLQLDPFVQTAEDSGGNSRYLRLVGPISGSESIRINSVEIPLGIAYRLINKQTMLFYVHARFLPAFVLSSSGDFSGNVLYDGILYCEDPDANIEELSEFRILRMMAANPDEIQDSNGFGPYHIGAKQFDHQTNADLSGLIMGLQLSPTAYFKFGDDNPGWGVLAGLDITYRLGSYLSHNTVNDPMDNILKYEDDFEGSVLNRYTDSVNGLSFGIRLGLFHSLRSDP